MPVNESGYFLWQSSKYMLKFSSGIKKNKRKKKKSSFMEHVSNLKWPLSRKSANTFIMHKRFKLHFSKQESKDTPSHRQRNAGHYLKPSKRTACVDLSRPSCSGTSRHSHFSALPTVLSQVCAKWHWSETFLWEFSCFIKAALTLQHTHAGSAAGEPLQLGAIHADCEMAKHWIGCVYSKNGLYSEELLI